MPQQLLALVENFNEAADRDKALAAGHIGFLRDQSRRKFDCSTALPSTSPRLVPIPRSRRRHDERKRAPPRRKEEEQHERTGVGRLVEQQADGKSANEPRLARVVKLKLARFRGYFPLGGERSTHGTQTAYGSVPAGIST